MSHIVIPFFPVIHLVLGGYLLGLATTRIIYRSIFPLGWVFWFSLVAAVFSIAYGAYRVGLAVGA